MKPYRLLILTASTSHEGSVEALSAWAHEFYGDKVDVKILRPLENGSSLLGYLSVDIAQKIQRQWPDAHRVFFPLTELMGNLQGKNFIGRGEFENMLHSFHSQLIVSFHPFLNRGYFKLAKEILGDDVRCVTYCGEFGAGYGLSRHWACCDADRWIGRSEQVIRDAYKGDVPPDKLESFTFLLPPPSKRTHTRRQLRLDDEKLTILFANGRSGVIDHLPMLQTLASFKDEVQAIVVCGLNERLRRHVQKWQGKTGLTMILEGFTHRQADYMKIADVVVSRGDADTATLALSEATPMFFDAHHGLMMEEELNVKFFEDAGVAQRFHSPSDFAKRIEAILEDPSQLTPLRQTCAQLKERYQEPSTASFMEKFLAWGFFKARIEQLGEQGKVV